MPDTPPPDLADHAADFAHRYSRNLDAYCAVRIEELGIPERLHGTRYLEGDGGWTAIIACDRQGTSLLEGIAVNSGCLNPQLHKGKLGERLLFGLEGLPCNPQKIDQSLCRPRHSSPNISLCNRSASTRMGCLPRLKSTAVADGGSAPIAW